MHLLPPRIGIPKKGSAAHRPPTLRTPEVRPHRRMGNGSWWKKRKKEGKILNAMKAKVNPQNAGTEVLSTRRTRREVILLVLKKAGDVSAFEMALDQVVGEKAGVKSLVSKRSLEVRDLDETVTREEAVAAPRIALGKPDFGDQCKHHKHFGGVQTAVVRLTEVDARSLLGLGRLRVVWVNCRIREHVEVARCFKCQGYGHVSRCQ